MKYPSKKNGSYFFPDHPKFRPNVSPREVMQMGSFGGTYWRPIFSDVTNKKYKDIHLEYPKTWWDGIPKDHLTRPWEFYDKSINKYNVEVGTTLEFWEDKGWITEYHPYGWFHWYCDFYIGKRSPDDERQIKRWLGLAGSKGRFRNMLINLIKKKNAEYNDYTISPKIRQTLLHWGYQLSSRDFNV